MGFITRGSDALVFFDAASITPDTAALVGCEVSLLGLPEGHAAQVWEGLCVFDYPVMARYVKCGDQERLAEIRILFLDEAGNDAGIQALSARPKGNV
jgi:hypothetical protein